MCIPFVTQLFKCQVLNTRAISLSLFWKLGCRTTSAGSQLAHTTPLGSLFGPVSHQDVVGETG